MKNRRSSLLTIPLCFFNFLSIYHEKESDKAFLNSEGKHIFIEVRLIPEGMRDSVELAIYPTDRIVGVEESMLIKQEPVKGSAEWSIPVQKPMWVVARHIVEERNIRYLAEPGDSLLISYNGNELVFSGKGAAKAKLEKEIENIKAGLEKPSHPFQYHAKSLQDYLEWNDYLNKQLKVLLPLIDAYKDKISDFAYKRIKFETIGRIEEDRLDKFWSLIWQTERLKITHQSLCDVFDSTFYTAPAKWMRDQPFYRGSYYAFIRAEVYRKYRFNTDIDSLKGDAKRNFLYYSHGRQAFQGRIREEFFVKLIKDRTIYEIGFNPETEKLLDMYYQEPGYPEYRKYVREYEMAERKRRLGKGFKAPPFVLNGRNGELVKLGDFKGKILLMNFWSVDCRDCIQIAPFLNRMHQVFKNDSSLVLLNIYTGKDTSAWAEGISKMHVNGGIHLYAGDNYHSFIKEYQVESSLPQLMLLDPYGTIVGNPLPDPVKDNGEGLTRLICRQLVLEHDGPYVTHKGDSTVAYTIHGPKVEAREFDPGTGPNLSAQTDEYNKTFTVTLKPKLDTEPAEFARPEKLIALSDIEGNFTAFRKLLQANKIIDENYNWIFGNGHLVFAGDMFDRGEQVTECLWLIYSLEEKAKAAGGYVHFILGNHEIMNLSGDIRYVQQKYVHNAEKMGKSYTELYSENSELGRWLRTKNIVEKIGDLLFIHAGISKEVAQLPLSLDEMNDLARPYYDQEDSARNSPDKILRTLYDAKLSPFWYRLYYLDSKGKVYSNGDTVYKTPMPVIESILAKFGVNRIVTGHTIVADTISIHYDGKVINTDTKHATGQSEALLIHGDKYYRVNQEGKKVLLLHFPSLAGNILQYKRKEEGK